MQRTEYFFRTSKSWMSSWSL